ncbi:hypothetical protein [Neobacillus sp. SAB-20_R2A]|uniref:hypothetical protein n=1 Tax=Neobacillus sp. SAB-20_R2A TaxID=3120519 RepID=UPI003C6DFF3E
MMCPGENYDIINEFKNRLNDYPNKEIPRLIDELYQELLVDFQFNEIEKEILIRIYSDIAILLPMYRERYKDASHTDTYIRFFNEISKLINFLNRE